jgi:SPX domain protein involved in polyphosphate accumulation
MLHSRLLEGAAEESKGDNILVTDLTEMRFVENEGVENSLRNSRQRLPRVPSDIYEPRQSLLPRESTTSTVLRGSVVSVLAKAERSERFKGRWMDFNALEKLVCDVGECKRNSEKAFIDELERQWVRYSASVEAAVQALLLRSKVVSRRSSTTTGSLLPTHRRSSTGNGSTTSTVTEVLSVSRFASVNRRAFKSIIKRHDAVSPHALAGGWKHRLRGDPSRALYPLLYEESNRFKEMALVREEEEEGNESSSTLTAPSIATPQEKAKAHTPDEQCFIRESSKYWVPPESITAVIAAILPHV